MIEDGQIIHGRAMKPTPQEVSMEELRRRRWRALRAAGLKLAAS